MKRLLFVLASYCWFSSALLTQAAVFERDWKTSGDGLLTYDDVNQREWLDLTETQLFKFPGDTLEERFQAVIAETAPSGVFDGFIVATESDVRSLAESGGINTSTLNFAVNGLASDALIDVLGNTTGMPDSTSNTRSGGFIAKTTQELESVWMVFNANARTEKNAGFRDTSGSLEPSFGFFGPPPLIDTSGVWIYRPVPEPSSFVLASGLLSLLMFASRPLRVIGSQTTGQ